MSKDHVLRELNARNVFDFELEDGRMYWVAVRVPGARAEWMNFVRAEGGTWRFQQRVHPLACPWEPQMVRTGQGIVGVEAEVGGGVARADSESASDPHAGEEGLSFIPGRSDPHAGVDALDAGGAADAPADRALAAHGMAGARPPPPPEPLVALSLDEMHAVAARLGELAAAESRSAGDVATAESEAPPPRPRARARAWRPRVTAAAHRAPGPDVNSIYRTWVFVPASGTGRRRARARTFRGTAGRCSCPTRRVHCSARP